jgi:metal-sulfur cluster biosynthetic enzyme
VEDPTPEQVREKLRAVAWPGFDQDIVAAGFVKQIDVRDGSVRIGFEVRTRRTDKVDIMEEGIRQVVSSLPGVERVEIRRIEPVIDPVLSQGGRETPLQAEIAADGGTPEPDPMLGVVDSGAELAPRWDGKRPGRGGRDSTAYVGALPVTQWDIDPTDPKAKSGEAHITLDDWEYRMWWQVHPAELVYVSIQAVFDDTVSHGRAARAHPVGRAVAVNLVYDPRRAAIVAIYGTANDFRPFVEAFRQGFGLPDSTTPTDSEEE